ncbi:MAG: hypothetical protein IPJ79_07730 [Bacteroidetes bacterium]|nr:hypothetical protein [Bacteroidota bacterium]
MTQTQRDALIATPGMVIHNTTNNTTQAYTTAIGNGVTPSNDVSSGAAGGTAYGNGNHAQSFVPNITGTLYSISLKRDGDAGTGTLNIRSGVGTGGLF